MRADWDVLGEGWDHGQDPDAMRAALAAARTGTWRWDAAAGTVEWDTTMEALVGMPPGSFGSTFQDWIESLHPEDRDSILRHVEEAVERRGSYQFEHRVTWPDGSVRWLECRGHVTTDASGTVTGTVGCAVDITDRKGSESELASSLFESRQLADRLARLQRISGLLAGAMTVEQVADIVVESLDTPNTTGIRALWLADDDSATLKMVSGVGFADDMAPFSAMPFDADLPVPEAYRERRTVLSRSSEEASARYPGMSSVRRSSNGFVAVPLTVGDQCSGVVVVGYDTPDLPDLDVRFVEAAAGHLAQTMSRIRLSEAVAGWARESTAAAERERRRREQVEFLVELTDAAIAAEDHCELMSSVASAAVPRLGDWCALHFLPEPGRSPMVEVAHVDADKTEWARRLLDRHPYDPDAPTGVATVIRTGASELIEHVTPELLDAAVEASPVDTAYLRQILDELDPTSAITVPLTTQRGRVGAMQFISAESGRHYDSDDVALAEAAAGRIADALHAMWVTDQHRHIADSLQRALLPPELPAVPGVDVAARYWAAGTTTEVGGDFYDVFPAPSDAWSLVIGDVCGTGADAAAVTAIARHTIRAAARHGHRHAEVLDWANEAVRYSDRNLFCTACYSTLRHDGTRWRLSVSHAGHPLAILRRADGTTDTIGEPGTLLGVFADIQTTTTDADLHAGDLLVLYTDGVTDLPEPFGVEPDEVLELVRDLPGSATADDAADAILASIAERVPDASRRDDVALLVLRILAAPTT